MLTTPNKLLLFQLLGADVQNKFFHDLSRDGGEADWRVVSQILILALFSTLALRDSTGEQVFSDIVTISSSSDSR